MTRLELEVERRSAVTDGITFRFPTNWTTVLFLGALGALHLINATTAFVHGRWEGYLSAIFATVFISVSVICRFVRSDLSVMPSEKQIRLRTGLGRLGYQRFVRFAQVRGVRLTLISPRVPESALIEIVCDGEVLECPPSTIPREEALCLAVAMGTRLIKVFGEGYGPASERIDQIPSA
jgi:hypothetical protein